MSKKKVRTVCTIGPASRDPRILRAMIRAGMDVARLNFSHGSHADHAETFRLVREAAAELRAHVAVLADLSGPKIRLTAFPDPSPVPLAKGETIRVVAKNVPSDPATRTFGCTYEALARDVKPGDRVLVDDGALSFRVLSADGTTVELVATDGGLLKQKKGINLPGVAVSAPALTDKDRIDLAFALTLPVDYFALSFVRRAEDVREAKRLIREAGAEVPVIAKIEREEAVDAMDEVIEASDGIMVARGDMGVELAPERVPGIQKRLVARANLLGRPVIVATQMLESMIENPLPTRAEASDVANAILDGADATMLSGETAAGKHPVEAVAMMERIGTEAEATLLESGASRPARPIDPAARASDAVCHAAVRTAVDVGARLIVSFTNSGKTALLVSKERPPMPVVGVTDRESTMRRMSLYWGVVPLLSPPARTTDEMIRHAADAVVGAGLAASGDTIVITAGIPTGEKGATNMIKVHLIP